MSEQSLRLFMLGIFCGNMEHSKFMMEIMFDSGKIGPVLCRLIIFDAVFSRWKKKLNFKFALVNIQSL